MIEKYVRLATIDDLPRLVELAEEFHRSSPYEAFEFSPEKTYRAFESVISGSLREGVILVGLRDQYVIGLLAGVTSSTLFSDAKIAMEMAWWVSPDYRRTRASVLLFDAYEDWARRIGCSALQGAYLPGTGTDLDQYFKKKGFERVEASYMKHIG